MDKPILEVYSLISEAENFEEGKNIFWKEVARSGIFKSQSGKVVKLTADYFDELIKNFKPEVDVPVPLGHDGRNDASKNTGYVKALERRGDSLFAKFDITDNSIAEKIKDKSIKHNSIGVVLKEGIGRVLDHIALTLFPAVSQLKPFEPAMFEAFEINLFEAHTETEPKATTKPKGETNMDEKALKELQAKVEALEAEKVALAKEKEAIELSAKEKEIDLELEKLSAKIPPAKRAVAKALMMAGKVSEVKELFEAIPSVDAGKKPVTTSAKSKEGKVKVMRESELEAKYGKEGVTRENFSALKGILKEVEDKKLVILPNSEFRANVDNFEQIGEEYFADYNTALNQLNTGSFLLPKIWETKLLNQLAEGNFGFDAVAVPASRANGYEVQWTVVGTLSRKGTSTGVGTATGTAGVVLTTVTMNPQRYGNSVSWTEEVNDWSVANVQNNIAYAKLLEDYRETMDREALGVLTAASAVLSANTVVGGTWGAGTVQLGSVGTFNDTATLTVTNVLQGKTILRKNRAAKFSDNSYICFASPEQIFSIQSAGTGWIDAIKYADSTRLISGEVGKYMGVRFVDSDMIAETLTQRKTAAGTGTSYTALMLGAEALGKGFDQMMKLTFYPDDHDDGGYFKRLQWNARGRYARLKATEIVPIVTTIAQVFYA